MSKKQDKEFSFDMDTEVEVVPEKGTKVKTSIYDKPLEQFLASGKAQVSITKPKVNGVEKTPDYVRQQLLGRVEKVAKFKGIDVRVVGDTVYIFKVAPTPTKAKAKAEPKPEPTPAPQN